jgi:hypothetical protein
MLAYDAYSGLQAQGMGMSGRRASVWAGCQSVSVCGATATCAAHRSIPLAMPYSVSSSEL